MSCKHVEDAILGILGVKYLDSNMSFAGRGDDVRLPTLNDPTSYPKGVIHRCVPVYKLQTPDEIAVYVLQMAVQRCGRACGWMYGVGGIDNVLLLSG
jgi:hypothetical protein